MPKTVRYQEESNPELATTASAGWRFRFDPDDGPEWVVLAGACPKCGHEFEYRYPLVPLVVAGELPDDRKVLTIRVRCRCSTRHPGSRGEAGCGRSWTLRVPRPAPTRSDAGA